jgi:hypothetical protein
MPQRLHHYSEPEPIGDTIKALKAKWPRLASKAGDPDLGSESHTLKPAPRASEAAPISSGTAQHFSDTAPRASEGMGPTSKPAQVLSKSVADRLEELFGLGTSPSLRKALYLRCQWTVLTFGKPAELVLREVVQYALAARSPGNCFAFTIVRRFRECGLVKEL